MKKDIERAFGNLTILWKFVSHPIEIWNLSKIANQITIALILHNIVVTKGIMRGFNRQYNPAETKDDFGAFGTIFP